MPQKWRFYNIETDIEFVGTTKEYVKYLDIDAKTLYKLISEGVVVKYTIDGKPCSKDGKHSTPKVKRIKNKAYLLRDYELNGLYSH